MANIKKKFRVTTTTDRLANNRGEAVIARRAHLAEVVEDGGLPWSQIEIGEFIGNDIKDLTPGREFIVTIAPVPKPRAPRR